MAFDIDSFKSDLDTLKNQRSVIQAKLDSANQHITELMKALNDLGFNTIEEGRAAYTRQKAEAESQHELVKQLIQEINQVDSKIPSKDEVMERLSALSAGNVAKESSPVPTPVVAPVETPTVLVKEDADFGDGGDLSVIASAPVSQLTNSPEQAISKESKEPDLGAMLFASL